MNEIIDWLIGIEKLAGDLYDGASQMFAGDDALVTLLGDLASDESWHYHLMGSAAEFIRRNPEIKSDLVLDSGIMDSIEQPLKQSFQRLTDGTLTKEDLLQCIVDTEYSEWNHIFVYVVNTLSQQGRQFMFAASKMQDHMDEITQYIQSLPDSAYFFEKINKIPAVWRRKFLVVDDFEPIRTVMKELLAEDGNVDLAGNGREALQKISASYYDVIVSDLDMPVMGGLDFCREAEKIDKDIKRKIIFCSGRFESDSMQYITDNNIQYLKKPMNIFDIRQKVKDILSKIECPSLQSK